MAAVKHTHTYVKYKSKPGYWRCNDKKCTFYIDHERVIGKLSLCNKCGAEFVLTDEDLRRVRPVCINCSRTKEAKRMRKVFELGDLANDIYAMTTAQVQTPKITTPPELPDDLNFDEPYFKDDEERF